MKIKFSLVIAIIAIVVFSSCKKETLTNPSVQNNSSNVDYTPLEVGNYWIYQRFMTDATQTDAPSNFFDSTIVTKDSIINGKLYFKYLTYHNYKPNWPFNYSTVQWLRDSLSYLKDSEGHTLFSFADFHNEFDDGYFILPGSNQDTICSYKLKMNTGLSSIAVPAGNYNCLVSKLKHSFFTPFDNYGQVKYSNICYSAGVGKVSEECLFVNSNDKMEMKLVRYHIQ